MLWGRLRQAAIRLSGPISHAMRKYTESARKQIIQNKPIFKGVLILSSSLCAALLLSDVRGKFLSTPKIKLTVSDRLVDAINRKIDLKNFDSCEGSITGHMKYNKENETEEVEEFDIQLQFKVTKVDKDE